MKIDKIICVCDMKVEVKLSRERRLKQGGSAHREEMRDVPREHCTPVWRCLCSLAPCAVSMPINGEGKVRTKFP